MLQHRVKTSSSQVSVHKNNKQYYIKFIRRGVRVIVNFLDNQICWRSIRQWRRLLIWGTIKLSKFNQHIMQSIEEIFLRPLEWLKHCLRTIKYNKKLRNGQ